MNFLKKYFSKTKSETNVILTIKISRSELNIAEYKDFRIVDCSEVLQKNNYNPLNDSEDKRIEYISEEIIHSEENILIYETGLSISDFDTISEMLKPYNLIISKILVPGESKRKKRLAEGQEAYRNHNRWLNFYPGEIEEMHEAFELMIQNLKDRYKNTETKIVEV